MHCRIVFCILYSLYCDAYVPKPANYNDQKLTQSDQASEASKEQVQNRNGQHPAQNPRDDLWSLYYRNGGGSRISDQIGRQKNDHRVDFLDQRMFKHGDGIGQAGNDGFSGGQNVLYGRGDPIPMVNNYNANGHRSDLPFRFGEQQRPVGDTGGGGSKTYSMTWG
uniref:Hymenoptaecin n=1 Tax=Romanomermis culicivorax TaxID=13658 RepID=A0A915HWC9_ROMCU